jgi:hypothetical protein
MSCSTQAPWVAAGIRFNDAWFTEPVHLSQWTPPRCGGLYVILLNDLNWAPKPFQPLYFGEFGNNARANVIPQDSIWLLSSAARGRPLFVSALPIPFSTTAQREAIRSGLVSAYNPACHTHARATVAAGDLTYQLATVEKKQEEHAAQLHLLLDGFNKIFGPQPEPPHRPIGFLPLSRPGHHAGSTETGS